MTYLLPIIFSIAGAFTYRWRGMSQESFGWLLGPRVVRRGLFATTLGLATAPLLELWAAFVPALAWYGIIVGHGSYFPRHDGSLNEDNEAFKWITKLISNPLDQKARVIGMALTGVSMTAPIGLLIMGVESVLLGTLILMVGFLKAVVYFVPLTGWDTEKAEWAWGAVSVGAIACLTITS